MFCHKCGNQMPDDVKFCNKCGAETGIIRVGAIVNNSIAQSSTKPKSLIKIIGLIVGAVLIGIFLFSSFSSDESTTQVTKSGGNGSTRGNKIVVGETKSYNNNFGNMEVTLEYVEFIDRIENEFHELNPQMIAEYTFPDDGHIFLRAELTLKNIGTEKATLPTAWNKVVYDGSYEFRHHCIEGQFDINPLAPPTTGTITFMVSDIVAQSDESLDLVLTSGGWSDMPEMTFVIRPGAGGSVGQSAGSPSESGSDTATSNAGEILYNGAPVINLIGSRLADLRDLLGNPDVEGVVWEGGTYGYRYDIYGDFDGIVFNKSQQGEDIEAIWGNPAALTFNGSSLDINRDGLVSLLGNPENEEWIEDYGIETYFILFINPEGIAMSFRLNNPNDGAHEFFISRY